MQLEYLVILEVLACSIDLIDCNADMTEALWFIIAIVIPEVCVVLCPVIPSQPVFLSTSPRTHS